MQYIDCILLEAKIHWHVAHCTNRNMFLRQQSFHTAKLAATNSLSAFAAYLIYNSHRVANDQCFDRQSSIYTGCWYGFFG